MKTYLVTGGSGFIGTNFINYILKNNNDIKIINLDKITYAGNINNQIRTDENKYKLIKGDICDIKLVEKLFEEYSFDFVVHFAAETHVDRSIDTPINFIQTNIIGTLNLLNQSLEYWNASSKKKSFKFLHISTDEVYGSLGSEGKFTEENPYNPSSPYSASKASADHLVRSWNKTYGLPTLITNCSNNYGPYQFPEKLIPLIIINCINEKSLPVYGDGQNIRDWLYVIDHCEAIQCVLEEGRAGQTYNIGGDHEVKNIDIVNTICRILNDLLPRNNGDYEELINFVEDRPGHDFRYAIDSTKLKNELGWKPRTSFSDGIKNTIKWYLKNENWWKMINDNSYQQQRLGVIE